MTSAEYCKIAVKALEDKKAEDVKVIDIRKIPSHLLLHVPPDEV